jgi:hypothetical protein
VINLKLDRMKTKILSCCLALATALLVTDAYAQSSNLIHLASAVFASAGGTSSDNDYTLTHTLGEAMTGSSSGGNYILAAGFLGQDASDPDRGLDLNLTASVSNVVATENFTVPLTVRVSNRGSNAASAVHLSVNLPRGLFAQAATNSAGACEVTKSNVTCSVASVPSQGFFTVDLTLRAEFLPESSDEFENLSDLTAAVSAAGTESNLADNGLALPVTVWVQLDWGDARGGFPVSRAENGARHRYSPGYRLGSLWDRQTDGFHSPLADWDDTHGGSPDDEDSVVFTTSLVAGTPAAVVVNSSFEGFLDAWADFNNDSDWTDAGEQIFASRRLVPGDNALTFTLPAAAVPGTNTTRWRVSTTGGLGYTGYGGPGEVEDHAVTIVSMNSASRSDLKVQLTGVPVEAEISGQPFGYTVVASNRGPNTATNVSVVVAHQELAVSGITVASADNSCQVVNSEVRCTVNALAPDQTATIDITVTPQSPGKLTLYATAASTSVDPTPADSVARSTVPVVLNVQDCACSCFTNAPRPVPDPLLTSWLTSYSGQYARAELTNAGPVMTRWGDGFAKPTPLVVNNSYADVQKIQYDDDFVYIAGNGLASYQMGPWYCDPYTQLFPHWPTNQTNPVRFPLTADVSVCDNTSLDAIGLWVNGTAIYNMLDGYFFKQGSDPMESPSFSADINSMGMSGVWNRDAWFSEAVTFDPGNFHTAQGQYHSHASPFLLRVQLGDNLLRLEIPVSFDSNQIVYVEQPNPALRRHSPILGWAFDGHPIYGPYGYADAMNSNSAIVRMRSGYVRRNGDNGTTDLNGGRETLPTWKRLLLGLPSSTLDPADYGPAVTRATDRTLCNDLVFSIGRYAEDNAFLGHLINPDDGDWFRQGEDFDLDLHNGRCCVTPEFPDGTYAYFVTIDEGGTPVFPYVLGWQYCGRKRGRENATVPTNDVTTYYSAAHPKLITQDIRDVIGANRLVTLQWSSREGGTYQVFASDDLQDWSPVSPLLPSNGTTSSYTYDAGPRPRPNQFFKVELTRDGGGQSLAQP